MKKHMVDTEQKQPNIQFASDKMTLSERFHHNYRELSLLFVLLALLVFLFYPCLKNMVRTWVLDGNFSHGYIVLLVAVYLVWRKRKRIASLPTIPSNSGIGLYILGLFIYCVGSVADIEFIGPVSLWICLVGLVLHVLGRAAFKEVNFYLFFLLFTIPWPDFVVEAISFPLQLLSTKYTVMMAGLFGIEAIQDGTSLYSGDLSFQVVAACSGVRSMVVLLAIGSAFAHLLHRNFWAKAVLFLAAIPIALVANVIRLFSIILVGRSFGQEIASTVFHDWTSPILFFICSALLMIIWLLLEPRQEKCV